MLSRSAGAGRVAVRCLAPASSALLAPRVQPQQAWRAPVRGFAGSALLLRAAGQPKPRAPCHYLNSAARVQAWGLAPQRSFASLPDHIVLPMPALSPTMEAGNIAAWVKKVGDKVKPGDVLCEVETDKATVAFESTEEGYLAKILVPENSKDVPVNKPVAIMVEEPADVAAFANYTSPEAAAPAAAAAAAPAAAAAAATPAAPQASAPAAAAPAAAGSRTVASPLARKMAAEQNLPLSQISGTGPNHRIVSADVAEFAARPAAAPKAAEAPKAAAAVAGRSGAAAGPSDYVDIPHSNMRKVIAKRLLESKQEIPHYYLNSEVRMDAVLKLREELNKLQAANGLAKISVNDFVIKAAALACLKVPQVNSSWQSDAVRQFNYVDVSVAVSTPTGLITPIVKDADIKGLGSIAQNVKDLAARARDGKLQPAEYQGGTFSISNLGMFGVKQFAAIINPPQAAILAVGGSEQRLVPAAGASFKDGQGAIESATFMSVTLSCDHRVIDGAVGAQWLAAFRGYMENPSTMLL